MRIIVLGGGVIGTTTAYFLARDGHDVEVVERHTRLAQDASSANAGLIAPGHSFSWASPAAPPMLLRSLLGAPTAIRVRLRADPELVRWGTRFLRECVSSRARANTLYKLGLCQYSQTVLEHLVAEEKLNYGHTSRGVLYVYRDKRELEAGFAKSALLRAHGQEQEILDPDACVRHEPALAPARDRIAGAVLDKGDSSGDCERFTNALADRCRGRGVRFRMGTVVRRLQTDGKRVAGAIIDGGVLRADLFLLCLGVDSPALARTIGQRLPIYPAKGYSATFPIRDQNCPPKLGGVDEATLVAWSNFGDRLRMSSTAEFTGYSRDWGERDFSNIRAMAQRLFPAAADYSAGEYRACLRPMTPGGPPIIGFGGHERLLYNTGHGHMGWTMACGSAKLAADLIANRTPDIPLGGFPVPA
jgi:D-amino-acid dehydrogenase